MTKAAFPTVQNRRLVMAAAIVAAIVFGPATIGLALPEQTAEVGQAEPTFLLERNVGTPDSVLDEVESFLDGTASEVPMWFSEEAGLLPDSRDVRVSGDGMVVGFVIDGEPGEAVEEIDEVMEAKGWTTVDLGGVDGKTYVKKDGPYVQVVMTATWVGGSTSVVMRCMSR